MPDRSLDAWVSRLCEQVEEKEAPDLAAIHADSALFNAMATASFCGSLYDRFKLELSRYGVGVLEAWISTGYIFSLTDAQGWSLYPSGRERQDLRRESGVALSLAGITVAVALKKFHSRALVGGQWHVDGGASLKTYFMGTVIGVFPNEFRRYRKEVDQAGINQVSLSSVDARDLDDMTCRDMQNPSDVAIAKVDAVALLADIADPRLRAMVALQADGWTLEEIADALGGERIRSIEGCLYRWRKRERRKMEEGGVTDVF